MMRHPTRQPVHNLLLQLRAGREALSELDVRERDFGRLVFFVDAQDGDVVDVWVGDEEAFELGGGDLRGFGWVSERGWVAGVVGGFGGATDLEALVFD